MKKFVFFILVFPLVMLAWTGTWDKGYVIEERIDTFKFTNPSLAFTHGKAGYINGGSQSNLITMGYTLSGTGKQISFPLLFSYLFYTGCEKVYIDSMQLLYYHYNDVSDNADTIWAEIDTIWLSNPDIRWYVYKKEQLPLFTSNAVDTVTFYDMLIKNPHRYTVTWRVINQTSSVIIKLEEVRVFYKAYYRVR